MMTTTGSSEKAQADGVEDHATREKLIELLNGEGLDYENLRSNAKKILETVKPEADSSYIIGKGCAVESQRKYIEVSKCIEVKQANPAQAREELEEAVNFLEGARSSTRAPLQSILDLLCELPWNIDVKLNTAALKLEEAAGKSAQRAQNSQLSATNVGRKLNAAERTVHMVNAPDPSVLMWKGIIQQKGSAIDQLMNVEVLQEKQSKNEELSSDEQFELEQNGPWLQKLKNEKLDAEKQLDALVANNATFRAAAESAKKKLRVDRDASRKSEAGHKRASEYYKECATLFTLAVSAIRDIVDYHDRLVKARQRIKKGLATLRAHLSLMEIHLKLMEIQWTLSDESEEPEEDAWLVAASDDPTFPIPADEDDKDATETLDSLLRATGLVD